MDKFDSVFCIGLTGGIGVGKTTVSNILNTYGAYIIDLDVIARKITEKNGIAIPIIKSEFGEEFLIHSNVLNRSKMRELIFSNQNALERMEKIMHPLIRDFAYQEMIDAIVLNPIYILLVVPLLFESDNWYRKISKLILMIDCSKKNQIIRVKNRDHLDEKIIQQIMIRQINRKKYLTHIDILIENNKNLKYLRRRCLFLHKKLTIFKMLKFFKNQQKILFYSR